MATTRAFKSGNSQAVRIPAELAYGDLGMDLTITRHGDVITIYPKRQGLRDAIEMLRRMPRPAHIEEREAIDLPERAGE